MPELVTVGRLLGAHGVAGTMRLLPLTDFPERFASMREMRLYREERLVRTLSVCDVRFHDGKNQVLVSSAEISDRDEAESLRGLLVKISPEERPELPEDTYWIDDLLGLDVRSETGESYGTLVDVLRTGASDVYVLRTSEGEERMFPATAEVVRRVDIKGGTIEIRPPDGLWNEAAK